MPFLFVGDPHATPDDLEDCQALADMVFDTAVRERATVVLLGDQYDTMGVIRAEVMLFWSDFFERCRDRLDVIALKGNHDFPGVRGSRATAMLAHVDQCQTVLYEPFCFHGILFCPFTHDHLQLIEWSAEHPECNTLVCHAEFNGGAFDNGIFIKDGIDPASIQQDRIISGHIHKPATFGKVEYLGSPRWRNENDANVKKAIWLMDFDEAGNITRRVPYDTGQVCRRIIREIDSRDRPLDTTLRPLAKDDYGVTIHGTQKWIDERRPLFEGWAKVRTTRTDVLYAPAVRESEGAQVAFTKYLDATKPRFGTPPAVIKKAVEDRKVFE